MAPNMITVTCLAPTRSLLALVSSSTTWVRSARELMVQSTVPRGEGMSSGGVDEEGAVGHSSETAGMGV